MSMVAGLTLPDGVVLVADGMVATFGRWKTEPEKLRSDVNKLEQVGPSIFAARFGIESVSGEIIERLRDGTYLSPGQVRDRLREVTAEVWMPDGSVPLERLGDAAGVGVLVGGLVGGVPFLSAILRHPTEDPKDIHWEDAWAMWVCGLEPEADERFYSTVGKAANGSLNRFGWPPFQGPMNNVILTVLGNAVKVMQDAAEDEPYSGGTFRTALVRKGYEPLEECVTITSPPQSGGHGLVHLGTLDEEEAEPDPVDAVRVATLTAVTMRTAVSGARIEIGNATYPNEISGYNSGGGMSLLIGPESIWTDYGYFDYIGHTVGVCHLLNKQVTGRFTLEDTQVYSGAAPVAWTDLNLSSYVGSRKALVLLMVENDGAISNNYRFRRNGVAYEQHEQADNYPGAFSCRCDTAQEQNWAWCVTDASGKIEWCAVLNNATKVRLLAFVN